MASLGVVWTTETCLPDNIILVLYNDVSYAPIFWDERRPYTCIIEVNRRQNVLHYVDNAFASQNKSQSSSFRK